MAAGKAGKAGERPIAAFAPDMSLLEAAKRKHPHASVLTAGQEAGLQLLQVADHLQQLGEAGMGAKASTVYEMVAEPISNAISQLMPKQYVHIRNIRGGLYDRTVVQVYRTWLLGHWSQNYVLPGLLRVRLSHVLGGLLGGKNSNVVSQLISSLVH